MWNNFFGAIRETIVLGFMMVTVGFIVWGARIEPPTVGPMIDHTQEQQITPTQFERLRVAPSKFERLPPIDKPIPAPLPTAPTEYMRTMRA